MSAASAVAHGCAMQRVLSIGQLAALDRYAVCDLQCFKPRVNRHAD
jgi:hypothetical protein